MNPEEFRKECDRVTGELSNPEASSTGILDGFKGAGAREMALARTSIQQARLWLDEAKRVSMQDEFEDRDGG